MFLKNRRSHSAILRVKLFCIFKRFLNFITCCNKIIFLNHICSRICSANCFFLIQRYYHGRAEDGSGWDRCCSYDEEAFRSTLFLCLPVFFVLTFQVKKWNAVALWAWDIVVDTCAICRNHIMDLCIECQANQVFSKILFGCIISDILHSFLALRIQT